jgi:hypothetical protein
MSSSLPFVRREDLPRVYIATEYQREEKKCSQTINADVSMKKFDARRWVLASGNLN